MDAIFFDRSHKDARGEMDGDNREGSKNTERENIQDTLIYIEFEKSKSKYFDDAVSKARTAASSSNTTFEEPSSSEGSYRCSIRCSSEMPENTDASHKLRRAREIWSIVDGWNSSRMKLESDLLDYPRQAADEEDLRELNWRLKRREAVQKSDFNESDHVIEVRFGPTSSGRAQKAAEKASDQVGSKTKSFYQRLDWLEDDLQNTGHLLVTRNATSAESVWEIVKNWKNAELRIDGNLATENKLKSLKRNEGAGCVWGLAIVLLLISIFFGVAMNS